MAKTAEKQYKGYCVKCKKKNVPIEGGKRTKMKNGRFAIKGTCGTCGTGMFRILGKDE